MSENRLGNNSAIFNPSRMNPAALVTLVILCCVISIGHAIDGEFEKLLSTEWVILNNDSRLGPPIPDKQCRAREYRYTTSIRQAEGREVFRVPHSRMYADGAKCGSIADGASEDQLYIDDHMIVAHNRHLTSLDAANFFGSAAIYRELFDANDRHRIARLLYETLRSKNLDVWVGFELLTDRVCGGKLVASRTSITLFARVRENMRIDLTRLYLPNTTTLRLFEYEANEPIQIIVEEPFRKTAEDPDRVCLVGQPQKIEENKTVGHDELAGAVQGTGNQGSSADKTTEPAATDQATNGSSCFPATANVALADGTSIPMANLELGTVVKTGASHADVGEVFFFSHKDPTATLHDFVRLRTASNGTITVSPGHYLYTGNALTTAGSILLGQHLIRSDGSLDQVIEVSRVRMRGLYNPHTAKGSMIIDDFLVSCYTSAVPPRLAHMLLTGIRVSQTSSLLGKLWEAGAEKWLYRGFRFPKALESIWPKSPISLMSPIPAKSAIQCQSGGKL